MGMPPARKADVVVAVDRVTPSTVRCLRQILEISDPALNRLIVVTGPCSSPALEDLSRCAPALYLLRRSDNSLLVEALNLGLLERAADVVLLAADTTVSAGWLSELADVAHSEERVAFASPLSNIELAQTHPETDDVPARSADADAARKAFARLPRSTTTPTMQGACIYLRGQILDAIGSLDATFSTLQAAIEDWIMRAQAIGYFGKRANHAYVQHSPSKARADDHGFLLVRDRTILEKRYPHRTHQVTNFRQTLDGRLAQHAINFLRTGKLRVAFDIRGIPAEYASIRTYAINLASKLALVPEIDLSLLVNDPAEAESWGGAVITQQDWRDDFAVIHKPAPFFKQEELAIPYGSSAHVIVTYQDPVASDVPAAFGSDADPATHRTTRSLSLLCAQGILADSQLSRERIASEFGIPSTEIVVVPPGVEADHAASALQCDWERTAQSTLAVYRSAVLNPSERSLRSRRMFRDAILCWSNRPSHPLRSLRADPRPDVRTMGVRPALKALNLALQRRIGCELRRLRVSRTRNRT
jgi:hypothetical protein